jgi:hypothetical protein
MITEGWLLLAALGTALPAGDELLNEYSLSSELSALPEVLGLALLPEPAETCHWCCWMRGAVYLARTDLSRG